MIYQNLIKMSGAKARDGVKLVYAPAYLYSIGRPYLKDSGGKGETEEKARNYVELHIHETISIAFYISYNRCIPQLTFRRCIFDQISPFSEA